MDSLLRRSSDGDDSSDDESGDDADDDSIVRYELDTPVELDLLELTNGVAHTLMDDVTIPAGTYEQIRFIVDIPVEGEAAPANPGSYVAVSDGNGGTTREPLFVPGGASETYTVVDTTTWTGIELTADSEEEVELETTLDLTS